MRKNLLLSVAFVLSSLAMSAQTTLAKWTFENDFLSESTIAANNGLEMQKFDFSFSGRSSYGGYKSDGYFNSSDWKFVGGAPKGYITLPDVSTMGAYSEIVVKFAFQHNAYYMSPPKQYRVEANIDGSATWTSLVTFDPAKNSDWQYFELTMTSEVLNKDKVTFRIAANTNKDYDDFGGAEGDINIDEIEIEGFSTTAIGESQNETKISILVANNILTANGVEVAKIEVFDLYGHLVLTSYENGISLANLNGVYVAKVYAKDGSVSTEKIIVR